MTAKELAAELLKHGDTEVVLKSGEDWCEVWGVKPVVGLRVPAIALNGIAPDLGGVIVIESAE